jgi:hypothetical protein
MLFEQHSFGVADIKKACYLPPPRTLLATVFSPFRRSSAVERTFEVNLSVLGDRRSLKRSAVAQGNPGGKVVCRVRISREAALVENGTSACFVRQDGHDMTDGMSRACLFG